MSDHWPCVLTVVPSLAEDAVLAYMTNLLRYCSVVLYSSTFKCSFKRAMEGRKKTVIVVKKKTNRKRKLPTGGIPSNSVTEAPPKPKKADAIHVDPKFDFDDDILPNEAIMIVRGLKGIPLFCNGESAQAPLEFQVVEALAHNTVNVSAMLKTGDLVRLRGIGEATASFLMVREDYEKIARIGVHGNEAQEAVDWFLRHLPDWSGRWITRQTIEQVHQNDPLLRPIEQTLKVLKDHGLIMLRVNVDGFQLWLPDWGKVLLHWNKAESSLLAHIKRSYHKERSLQSCEQKYSPIPTALVISWLVFDGQIASLERPSGTFLKLPV